MTIRSEVILDSVILGITMLKAFETTAVIVASSCDMTELRIRSVVEAMRASISSARAAGAEATVGAARQVAAAAELCAATTREPLRTTAA